MTLSNMDSTARFAMTGKPDHSAIRGRLLRSVSPTV